MDTRKTSLIISIIVLLIVSIFVWKTEWFQCSVFPKRYWAEKVNELEQGIRVQEFMIRDANIELAKMLTTIQFDMAQEANLAELTGIDRAKAIEEARETKKEEIETFRETIDIMRESVSKEQKELEMARKEIAKYQ